MKNNSPKEDKITKNSYKSESAVQTYNSKALKWTEDYIFHHYFQKPGLILDLGCGTGRTSYWLQKAGHKVIAVDYSSSMIKKAKENYLNSKIKFKVMDARKLLFPANYFDYILFSFNGLDGIFPRADRTRALMEIFRVLKLGGVFAMSSHNSLFIPNNLGRVGNLLRSILCGKIFPYRWDSQVFGKIITFFISPHFEIKELKSIGFGKINVVSKYSQKLPVITLKDPYPSYVAVKSNN